MAEIIAEDDGLPCSEVGAWAEDKYKIDWVIVGGESGPGARPVDRAWVTEIRDQCLDAGVPFFFKQWGGTRKKKAGRELEGRTWESLGWPSPLGVRSSLLLTCAKENFLGSRAWDKICVGPGR